MDKLFELKLKFLSFETPIIDKKMGDECKDILKKPIETLTPYEFGKCYESLPLPSQRYSKDILKKVSMELSPDYWKGVSEKPHLSIDFIKLYNDKLPLNSQNIENIVNEHFWRRKRLEKITGKEPKIQFKHSGDVRVWH